MKKWLAIGALWVWIALLFATHWGARSPYSYGWAIFGGKSARLLGTVVNPDAIVVYPVTLYFYEAQTPANWGASPNFRLPFHSFIVATLAAFTRSYLASNYAANVGALLLLAVVAVNAAARRGLPLVPTTIALGTMAAMPWVPTYLGQPMHYTVGITINFLAAIAASALSEEELRRPWLSGVLLAIVMLNYDAYIFAAALAAYVLFVVRFRRARDYAVFLVTAVAPVALWVSFLRLLTHDKLSRMIQMTFIDPVVDRWVEFLKHPATYATQPFLAAHIGIHVGAHMILAMIYWPVLLLAIAGVWHLRREIPYAPLVALLLLMFALHQVVTAGFDWENNPRRALPVVLAAGFVDVWLAARLWPRRGWRAAFVAVLVLSCGLAMADTFLRTPVIPYLSTGQAIQHNPKEAMSAIRYMRFHPSTMPALLKDDPPVWHDLGRARPIALAAAPFFAFAQVFNAVFVCALLWLLARAQLLPRFTPLIGAALWAVSLVVRFV